MKLIWVTFNTCATLVLTSQTTVRRLMVVLQTPPHRPSLRTTWILVHISGNLTYMATWYCTVIKYTIADAWHFIYNNWKMKSHPTEGHNIVSNCGRMHHLPSLFSKCSRYFQNIISNRVRMRQSTSLFSKVPRLPATYFTPLDEVKTCAVFLIAVLNIVSKSVIIHAKASLFQNDLCGTISFQIPSKYTINRPYFHFCSAV